MVKVQEDFVFIRGGLSSKGNNYLQVSNGRNEFFINVPKTFDIKPFASYSEGDKITLELSILVGSSASPVLEKVVGNY